MPFVNFHAARLKDPNLFDSFRTTKGGKIFNRVDIPATIEIIWGHLKGESEGTFIPQALRFDVSEWTVARSRKFLKDNDIKFISFEPAEKEIDMTMQLKFTVPFVQSEFKEDGQNFSFKGYASTFGNVDLGGDVVMPGAFGESLKKRMPKMLYQHDYREPIGVFTMCREDEKGLYVEGILPKDNSRSRDVASLIRCKAIDSMSIGYRINNTDDFEVRDGIRYLKNIDLWEASWVTFPMNPEAKVTDMKAVVPFQDLPLGDQSRAWDGVRAEARVRAWAGASEGPNERYKRAFLWFDSESPENFTSYKLQIADVIDGTLTAMPRGIFAAAGVMRGARGGVDIPAADKERVIANLKRYYAKMELEDPFEKALTIDEVDSIKALNEYLKQWGLSNSERNAVVAKFKQLFGLRDEAAESQREAGTKLEVPPELAAEMEKLSQEIGKHLKGE